MAKVSSIKKNLRRIDKSQKFKHLRSELKKTIMDKKIIPSQRFLAVLKLSEMPKDSSIVRVRNRCGITGKSRGFIRKLGLCRNKARELAGFGMIPGLRKSSW